MFSQSSCVRFLMFVSVSRSWSSSGSTATVIMESDEILYNVQIHQHGIYINIWKKRKKLVIHVLYFYYLTHVLLLLSFLKCLRCDCSSSMLYLQFYSIKVFSLVIMYNTYTLSVDFVD